MAIQSNTFEYRIHKIQFFELLEFKRVLLLLEFTRENETNFMKYLKKMFDKHLYRFNKFTCFDFYSIEYHLWLGKSNSIVHQCATAECFLLHNISEKSGKSVYIC